MRAILSMLTAVALAIGMVGFASAAEIVIGAQCDRTGPTQTVGVNLCPGFNDYIKLVNSKGGVGGHTIRADEVDNEYKVPPAVESYERYKKEGAVTVSVYGTPQIYALTQKLTEDRIPGTSPGFGKAAAADGTKYPYIFPIAATYWSQAAAAVKYAKDQLGGNMKGKKIAYIFYDNPAGREPFPVLEELQKLEGFEMRTFAVPPPGVEMGAQVLDIAQRYRADFVISHLFGRSPSVAIKELKRVGYPLKKVVSFVWGAAEADVEAAGGYGVAEGYSALRLPGAEGDPGDVQEGGQARAQGDEGERVLQPRRVPGRDPRRGHPQRGEGQAGRQDHRGRRQGRLREDQGLHPGRPSAPARDHPDRPRGRRTRAGVAGERRQVGEADRLVPRVSRGGREGHQGSQVASIVSRTPGRRRAAPAHRPGGPCSP